MTGTKKRVPYAPVERLSVGLAVGSGERPVGTLAWHGRERRAFFEFSPGFLETPLPLSPFRLPTGPGVQAGSRGLFDGLHGLFADSLPDGWGRKLLDRQMAAQGVDHRVLTPLDRLAFVGARGMGALTYRPETDTGTVPKDEQDLDWLATQASRVERELPSSEIEILRGAAGGSGGARPKMVLLLNPGTGSVLNDGGGIPPRGFGHWLVKFRSVQDGKEIGREEFAYSLMAAVAGVEMPRTRLITTAKAAYFAVERFDRSPSGRHHVHTLGGMIGADHGVPGNDYRDLMKVTQALTGDLRCLRQVVARTAFNVLARNRDDHVKNHSFVMDGEGRWRLSPAYDVTWSVGPGGEHNMTIGGEGAAPTVAHVERLAAEFRLPRGEVSATLDAVRSALKDWGRFADQAGLSARRTKEIARALAGS